MTTHRTDVRPCYRCGRLYDATRLAPSCPHEPLGAAQSSIQLVELPTSPTSPSPARRSPRPWRQWLLAATGWLLAVTWAVVSFLWWRRS